MMNHSAFQSPEPFFRGTDLWMLNGRLDDAELRRQIGEMKEKGFYSFIARTYNGIETDYPGPAFMAHMKTIVAAAKEYGMKVVLQAKYMPAAVLELPEEFALRYIDAVPDDTLTGGETVLCRHGGVSYVERMNGAVLNLFDEPSVAYYVNLCYGAMWADFADEFGKTILSVWVDEPRFKPWEFIPWSPNFERVYRELYGEALLPQLYLLYTEEGDYKLLRYRFRAMMEQLLDRYYYPAIRDWCHSNGLLLSGHLMGEESTYKQIEHAVCNLPYYRYFDLPGVDFLAASMNWRYDDVCARNHDSNRYYNTPIGCVSAAHQAGKEHILCEMFGVTQTNLTFRAQKHIFEHFAALGINHRCAHALFYSTAGFRKTFYPHQINYYEPYWEKYRLVNDDCARTAQFVSLGEPVGNVLVVHAIETGYMLYRGNDPENAEISLLDRRIAALSADLSGEGGFEYGDQSIISQFGSVEGKQLRVGKMTYRTVVLPYLETLRGKVFALLKEFRAAGGRVILLGKAPDRLEGAVSAEVAEAMRGFELADNLAGLREKLREEETDYRFEPETNSPQIIVNHRRSESTHYFFLHDLDCAKQTRARLSVAGRYEVFEWHSEDGGITPCDAAYADGRTTAFFTVPEGGGVRLSFERNDAATLCRKPVTPEVSLAADGGWRARLADGKNLLMLDFCRIRKEGETAFSAPLPACAVNDLLNKFTAPPYAGMIEIRFDFTARCELEAPELIIEEPENQEIFFNGEAVAAAPTDYYYSREYKIVRLPGKVRCGQNSITLRRQFCPETKKERTGNSLFELFINGKGSEIEPVFLRGAFRVNVAVEPNRNSYVRACEDFSLSAAPEEFAVDSDIVTAGYPFYVGDLLLKKRVQLPPEATDGRPVWLKLGELHACTAELFVNGVSCGDYLWEPFALEVGKALKPGENVLELRLKTTLRNMIGPHHHAVNGQGVECGDCSTSRWKSGEAGWMRDINRVYDMWTKEYHFVQYGVYGVFLAWESR